MNVTRIELVSLLNHLGDDHPERLPDESLAARAGRVAAEFPEKCARRLPEEIKRLLFVVQAAVQAEAAGWGSPLAATGVRAPRGRKKARGLSLFSHIDITRRDGRSLFAWLQKNGRRDPSVKWRSLTPDEKQEAAEEAAGRIIEAFIKGEYLL